MDEYATWYGSIDLRADKIVLDWFPVLRERGTAPPPPLGPCLLWPRSPISATAELLLYTAIIDSKLLITTMSTRERLATEGPRDAKDELLR